MSDQVRLFEDSAERDDFERKLREHHQIVRSEPVSFAVRDGRIYPKGTPEYDRLLADGVVASEGIVAAMTQLPRQNFWTAEQLLEHATTFTFPERTAVPMDGVDVVLTCRAGEGPYKPPYDTWAVRWLGRCLNSDGRWEFEPQPSSRTDDFLARTRWSRNEALRRAAALPDDPRLVGTV